MQTEIYRKIADTFEIVNMADKLVTFLKTDSELDRLAIAHSVSYAYYGRLSLDDATQVQRHLLSLVREFRCAA